MKLKITAAALATAVVTAWLIVPAQSDFPRMNQAEGEKLEAKGPPKKAYIVVPSPQMPANGQPEDILRSASILENSLNESHGDGYRFTGMNEHFVIMEQAPPPPDTRRRVVLPLGGQPTAAPKGAARASAAEAPAPKPE
jgi:hypothetical protein